MPFSSETAKLAGLKSKRGLSERTKILNELFNKDKAEKIFHQLEKLALDGDMDAIKTYLAYCFGKPEAKIDLTSDGQPILTDGLARLTSQQLMELKKIKETIEQN